MNKLFSANFGAFKRVAYAMLATLLVVAGLPMLRPGHAGAAPIQLSNRSIQLSDSAPSGTTITTGVGSGADVTYQVGFTASSAAHSMVIDFCSNSPLIGDACTTPAGLSVTSAALQAVAGDIKAANNWSVTAVTTGGIEQLKLHDDGNSGHEITASQALQQFNILHMTNPSSAACPFEDPPTNSTHYPACSFYARIYTYADNSYGSTTTAYTDAQTLGDYQDYGGIAMTTVQTITISARVQEQLTYCLTTADPTTWNNTAGGGFAGGQANDCSASEVASNPPALTLGHGGPPKVLDSTATDTGTLYSQLSTNATNGAVVTMRNSNATCTYTGMTNPGGGLSADGGTTCAIPPVNSGAASTAAASDIIGNPGTAAFGLFVSSSYHDAATASSTGSLSPIAPYHTAGHAALDPGSSDPDTYFGMDTATTAANGGTVASNVGNVTTTFGSIVANTSAPTYRVENNYVFAATAALTTPAGIYTANLSMIATGTF